MPKFTREEYTISGNNSDDRFREVLNEGNAT
jgi:hypothetical protein